MEQKRKKIEELEECEEEHFEGKNTVSQTALIPQVISSNRAPTPLATQDLGSNEASSSNQKVESQTCEFVTPLGPEICVLEDGETLEHHLKVREIKVLKTSLMLPMLVIFPDGLKMPLRALVDTGCESTLVRMGLIPQQYFFQSQRGVRLITSNGSVLGGGNRQFKLDLIT